MCEFRWVQRRLHYRVALVRKPPAQASTVCHKGYDSSLELSRSKAAFSTRRQERGMRCVEGNVCMSSTHGFFLLVQVEAECVGLAPYERSVLT